MIELMQKRICRMGAGGILALLLVFTVMSPFETSVAGDGGLGPGIPSPPPDTTGQNAVPPDTTTTSGGSTVIVDPWLTWLL